MLEPRKKKRRPNKWAIVIPILLVLISSVLVFNGRVWSNVETNRYISFAGDTWNMTSETFAGKWKINAKDSISTIVFTVDLSEDFRKVYPTQEDINSIDPAVKPFTISAKYGSQQINPTSINPLGGDNFEGRYEITIPFAQEGRLDINIKILSGVTKWVTQESSHDFFITRDTLAPLITITGPENEVLYPSDVNVKVQVEEENFISNNVEVIVYRNEELYTKLSPWTNTQKTTIQEYLFQDDGDYKITISSTDIHGNVSDPKTINFSILHGTPGLTIKDKVSQEPVASNGYISSKELQAIVESEVAMEKATIRINSQAEKELIINNNNRTAYINFPVSHGEYEIEVFVTPKSKREEPYKLGPFKFLVDTTNPVVSISSQDIDGEKVINGKITESYLDLNRSKIIKRVKDLNGEQTTDIKFSSSEESIYTSSDKVRDDGIYYYELIAFDKAGNKNEEITKVEFTIDNNDPILSIIDEQRNGLNNKYFKETKKVYISVKDLTLDLDPSKTFFTVTSLIDGKKIEEKFNLIEKLFNFAEVEKEFSEDGEYSINLKSTDQFGNYPQGEMVSFIIDKTHPELKLEGINVDEKYGGEQNLTVKLIDQNIDLQKTMLEVYRDGVQIDVDQLDTIERDGEKELSKKQYNFTEDGVYEVRFKSKDKALNESIHPPIKFTIDQNDPVLKVTGIENNKHYPESKIGKFTIEDLTLDISKAKPTLKVTYPDGKVIEHDHWKKDNSGRIKIVEQELSFNEEGDYKIEFSALDTKENSFTYEPISFTIDKRYPKVELTGINNNSFVKGGNSVDVQVKEYNHGYMNVDIYYKVNGSKEQKLTWINKGEVSNNSYQFDEDGDYLFTVIAKDKAGNKTLQEVNFTIDNIKPKIDILGPKQNSYHNTDKNMKITVEEHNFANNKVDIKVTRKVEVDGKPVEYPIEEWENVKEVSELSHLFERDGEYEITVEATDAAGNKGDTAKLHFTIDKTDPKVELETDIVNGNNYRKSMLVKMKAEDRNIDLSNTNLEVKKNGKTFNVGELKLLDDSKIIAFNSYTFFEEGNYVINLNTRDKAGNYKKHDQLAFIIDKTNPVVKIDGVENNSFNPENKNVTISIDELNYKTNNVSITATKDGSPFHIGNWDNTGKLSKLGYNFTRDGLYTILATAEDKAGNGPISEKMIFTIDKTNPSIEITGVENNAYYNVDKPVNVAIKDVNLDINKITVTRNGARYNAGGFSVNGDLASFRHNFSGEGKYNILVEATDKAGNSFSKTITFTIDKTKPVITPKFKGQNRVIKDGEYINEVFTPEFALDEAEDMIVSATLNNGSNLGKNIPVAAREMKYIYKVLARDKAGNESTLEISFTLDTTKPALNISGVLDGFFNKDITPKVTYSDIHLDSSKTSVTLNGKPFENGAKLEYEQDYILKVVVTDLAKNVSSRTIVFTIDKTKPVIKFKEPISNNYFNTDLLPQLLIEDMSAYDIIAMMLDGKPYEAGDPIKEEGKHVMFFEVKDKAGNIQQLSVEFIIDKTAPKVVYEGVKNKEKYYDPVDIAIRLDNPNDKIKSVMINGEMFEGDVVEENGYKVIKTTLAEINPYEIKVTASDEAGNEKTTVISFEIVEKGALVKFYENKPLLGGTIAGLISLVAAATTLVVRRRRTKVEE
jgi:large repetitive protein